MSIELTLLRWRLWPIWRRGDPRRVYIGPIVITWGAFG